MIRARSAKGFTLVELIIVMTLLAVVAALAVPSLSRSMRQRNLDEEATRLLALTEYSRDEAVSQGVPMIVWIEPEGTRFGVGAKSGFEGVESRDREFVVNADVHFEMKSAATKDGVIEAMEFAPDGSPATSNLNEVRVLDRFDSVISLAKTSDGWSYEIVKETK